MDGYQHGGYQTAYGGNSRRVLDFSASVSPLGVPVRVRRAIRRAAEQADRYPDPQCRRLRQAIGKAESAALRAENWDGRENRNGRDSRDSRENRAESEENRAADRGAGSPTESDSGADRAAGIPPDWILCGSGAADLIYRVVQAVQPVRAVIPAPTFSEYEAALRTYGCTDIERVYLSAENGFQPEFAFFQRFMGALSGGGAAGMSNPPFTGGPGNIAGSSSNIAGSSSNFTGGPSVLTGPRMAFLCQPNNPTGVTIPVPVLAQILEHCRERGFLLVLDECFLPFLDRPEDFTLSGFLASFDNLLILRAFTKIYAMAGVRLGYALSSNGGLLDRMDRYAPPWSVSALAQAAGLAALDSGDYLSRTRRLVARERAVLLAGLNALGLRAIPGEANFLLFRSPVPLDEPLWEQGIVLRNCANFYGLDESWYRAAVRTGPENRRLLNALGKILERVR